jgi:CheY-like chemotaxis protein
MGFEADRIGAPTMNAAHARPKALLVDDRHDNLTALEAMLQSLPLDTVAVGSGEEALKQLLIDDFAVIVLDAQMPDMDGFETAEHIKRRVRTRSVPIIFLTAADRDAQLAMRGYAVGAVDYLTKPFEPWILRAKVSVLVDLWMKTRQLDNDAESAQRRLWEGRQLVSAVDQAVALLDNGDADQAVRVLRQAADRAREPFL